jgi:tetratricopeptide (TPR) repeat protein
MHWLHTITICADLIEHAILKVETWSQIDTDLLGLMQLYLKIYSTLTMDTIILCTHASSHRANGLLNVPCSAGNLAAENPGGLSMIASQNLVTFDRILSYHTRFVQEPIAFARRILQEIPENDLITRSRALSILGSANFRSGNVNEASRIFTEIVEAFAQTKTPFVAVIFACHLAEVQIIQGQLTQALQTCERAMSMGMVDGSLISPAGFARLIQAKIYYERNDLNKALGVIEEGLELLRRGSMDDVFSAGQAILALIHQAKRQQSDRYRYSEGDP